MGARLAKVASSCLIWVRGLVFLPVFRIAGVSKLGWSVSYRFPFATVPKEGPCFCVSHLLDEMQVCGQSLLRWRTSFASSALGKDHGKSRIAGMEVLGQGARSFSMALRTDLHRLA